MKQFHITTRRGFLSTGLKAGLGVALATLTDIPFVLKRALAEGNIGGSGKKVLFIWLRGANDALNSVIPVQDTAYNNTNRPSIYIPKDVNTTPYGTTGQDCFDLTRFSDLGLTSRAASDATYVYNRAIPLGNGFAALHPSLKFLAPVYNAGDLALIQRVGYPKQSRSHFDSQNYWENGAPGNNLVTNGIFYRAMVQALLNNTAVNNGLTGVSIQSALPLILRGSGAAMTNLTDPTRYNLLGVPNTTNGNDKADNYLNAASGYEFPAKMQRAFLDLQYQNLNGTLKTFANINFNDTDPGGANDGNTFVDDINTDNDAPYYLFPTRDKKNGGYTAHGNDPAKRVVDTSAFGFFTNLKAAAMILNNSDAIITGTEFGGFDTHNAQGGASGAHANLQRRIGWTMYALRKYFQLYGKGGARADVNAKVSWNDVIVVTLSEFGRTTIENNSLGTDHAEAGLMLVAGGAVQGYTKNARPTGVFCCGPGTETYNTNNVVWNTGQTGTMFGVGGRYLKRAVDYRSVLGEIVAKHLGATRNQLTSIIPGYAVAGEGLQNGGTSSVDGTDITGELGILA